jgi:hypothetical protein
MVQLKVYAPDGSQHWLDLYPEDPIKITLSIEDITDTSAKSAYSRTFRVPNTPHNSKFFKTAFEIEGIDYDVTVKKRAHILVDGALFREGHIRLQKIYRNMTRDVIDYEIVFLGETRDFSSALGDASLCQLNLNHLEYTVDYATTVQSWDAFPQGGLNDGLHNGDVILPLIDFGNTYNSSGVAQETRIASSSATSPNFTQNSNPLQADRFKPMIRAKAVIDAIFERADYTYDSAFFESDRFRHLYVSAFGNTSSVTVPQTGSANTMFATGNYQAIPGQSGYYELQIFDEVSDPGNNYDPSVWEYTAPISGNYTFVLGASIEVQAPQFNSIQAGVVLTGISPGTASWTIYGNTVYAYNGGTNSGTSVAQGTIYLNAGEKVQGWVNVDEQGGGNVTVWSSQLECFEAPGAILPGLLLDCNYKQVDFIKDILTMFRLVMAPDKINPKNFIIEPWVDYVASGETYDWSDRVDHYADIQIEPLFFTQSNRIEFKNKEDGDWINDYFQKSLSQTYGQLNFNSGNDLLKGTREITTIGLSATPLYQLEGQSSDSTFIIPQLHIHGAGDSGTEHRPIKGNTRLLFYNGRYTYTPDPGFQNWNFESGTFTDYPLVSVFENFPPNQNSLHLTWTTPVPYFGSPQGINGQAGISLYNAYWSGYIESLYNKYARRVSLDILLNNVDLQNFSFDDIVFIDGVYYRPEKVLDAPIGDLSPVKVQLIKLLDYSPLVEFPPAPIPGCTDPEATNYNPNATVDDGSCTYAPGPVYGCTDPNAVNYNPNATVDDGSCYYAPTGNFYRVQNCDNPTLQYIASYSPGGLVAGQAVNLSILPTECFIVIEPTDTAPTATVLQVFNNCIECGYY